MMKFVLGPLLLRDQIKEEGVGGWVTCHAWMSNACVILDWKPGAKEII